MALVVTVPAAGFFPSLPISPASGQPLWVGLLGGPLFGLGAALNKGCSFSTLQRLADGDWRMLVTLAGYCGGSALCYLSRLPFPSAPTHDPERISGVWFMLATLVLWGWAIVMLVRMRRQRVSLHDLIHGTTLGPVTTGLLLGLGASALYLGFGPWTYTNTLQAALGSFFTERPLPPASQLFLVPVLFIGMVLSAWQRRAADRRLSSGRWGLNLAGGTLMGLGGVLIPGGNDTLLLRLIPALAPSSLWVYLALLGGVAIGLMLQRQE